MDCFYVGWLAGTKGVVWQYTAIDIAAGACMGEPYTSQRNPVARDTKSLLHRVAQQLAAAGWKLTARIPDNGSAFRPKFADELARACACRTDASVPAGLHQERLQFAIFEQAGDRSSLPLSHRRAPRSHKTSSSTSTSTTTTGHTPDHRRQNPAEIRCGARKMRAARRTTLAHNTEIGHARAVGKVHQRECPCREDDALRLHRAGFRIEDSLVTADDSLRLLDRLPPRPNKHPR